MFTWQIEEYLSVLPLLAKALWANRTDSTIHCARDAFGPHPNQYVLLCCPAASTIRRDTFIYFAHGGGWRTGAPIYFRFVGYFFAKLGFPTLLTGYRLAPASKYPAQVEDVSAGLSTGIGMLRKEGIPVNKVIFAGQSSGAQLLSLLAFDPTQQTAQLLQREAIDLKGLFLVSGPLDFSRCVSRTIQKYIGAFIGNTSNWDQANPICYIHGHETIPVLCVHGDRDPLVDVNNSLVFIDRFAKKNNELVRSYIVSGGHHSDMTELFLNFNHPAVKVMCEWLDRCNKKTESF
jgi:acetyl esterase/lipase